LALMQLDTILLAALVGIICLAVGAAVGVGFARLDSKKEHPPQEKQSSAKNGEKTKLAERKRQQSIYHLINILSSTLNYQKVLDTALDLSADILSPDEQDSQKLVSAVMLFTDGEGAEPKLRVESSRRFSPADQRNMFPGKEGLLAEVIETGEAAIIHAAPADPELMRTAALYACQSICCLPLQAGLDTYGVLLFGHPDKEYFTSERFESLEVITKQAVIAIQNARLYENLEREKERMMEIQEEARKKLARDLHDGPTQSVAAIAMRINFARRMMEKDASSAVDELYKIEDVARRTTKEIRHMLFTLRPLILESQGLLAALQAMAEKMRETYDQNVIIEADPQALPDLEIARQTVIFYIVEEAVNNARKHAKAAAVTVRLSTIENDLALVEIEDDGVGFNVAAVDAFYDKRDSLGMINMRERAELVNGVLRIDSVEGRGTLIQVLIPLSDQAAERLRSVI
jgi:signal transduction histidine kinase